MFDTIRNLGHCHIKNTITLCTPTSSAGLKRPSRLAIKGQPNGLANYSRNGCNIIRVRSHPFAKTACKFAHHKPRYQDEIWFFAFRAPYKYKHIVMQTRGTGEPEAPLQTNPAASARRLRPERNDRNHPAKHRRGYTRD